MQANTTLSGAFFLESFTSTDVFPETSQVSKMEVFAEIINSWKPLTIFSKSSI